MAVIRDSATYKPSEKKTISATINNSNNTLSGFVNKQVEALNYGGGETDSLIINVDNENNIITGDVKWQAFLGESNNAAYPGDKGADNHNKIMDLFGILNDEIKRAIQAEGMLQFKLDSEISERVSDYRAILSRLYELEDLVNGSIRTDLAILSNRVDKAITDIERNKRLSEEAIAEVSSSVRKEEKRAISAESALSNKIEVLEDEVDGKIIALSDDVTKKFNDVHSTISSEVETLRETIDEVSTGLTVDYSSKISAVESATNEKLGRVDSDLGELGDKLNAEIVDRQKADSTMNSNMKSIESSLLTVINDKFDGLSPRIDSNAAKINGLQSQMNTSVNQLSNNISTTNNRLDLIEPKIDDETKNRKAMDDSIISSLNRSSVESREYADSLISPVLAEVSEIKAELTTLSTVVDEDLQGASDKLAIVSTNLDDLTSRLSEEVLVRKSSDEELRNEIARNNTLVQEDITSLRKEVSDNKAKDDATFLSISSKFVSVDKALADTSSAIDEEINQLELQLSEEVQNRISADAGISSAIKLVENNLVNYVDTSIETTISEMHIKDTEIESDLLNQIETVSAKINAAIKDINSTIDELNNDLTEEAYQRALLESSVKSDIAVLKSEATQYTDISATKIRGEMSTLNSNTKQYLLSELSKSTTDLRASIAEINALANNLEVKLKKEYEDRLLGDAESVATASRLVSDMSESVLSKLNSLKTYVDTELKSAVEKLDAYDVVITQKINNEINRAKRSEDLLHNQIAEEEAERKTEDLKLDRSINILSAHSEERVLLVRSELMGLISDERIRAELAESSIIERFDTLEETMSAEFVHRFSEEDPQLRVYSEQNGEVVPVVASMGTYGSTIVMRDTDGKIPLISGTDELSSFKNSDAVPKLYVDMKASETEDTIMKNVEEAMSFTFIDGGNAPIPKT